MIWTGFIYLKEKENKIRKTLHKTSIKKYNLFSYWQYLGKFELSTSTFKARILLKVHIKSDIKKSILFFFSPQMFQGISFYLFFYHLHVGLNSWPCFVLFFLRAGTKFISSFNLFSHTQLRYESFTSNIT